MRSPASGVVPSPSSAMTSSGDVHAMTVDGATPRPSADVYDVMIGNAPIEQMDHRALVFPLDNEVRAASLPPVRRNHRPAECLHLRTHPFGDRRPTVDPRLRQLLDRLAEVSDDQLGDLEDVIRAGVETAATQRDVAAARELANGLEQVRAERGARVARMAQEEQELGSLVRAARGEPDPALVPEPEPDHRPLPSIADLASRRTARASFLPGVRSRPWMTPDGSELNDIPSVARALGDRLRAGSRSTGRSTVASLRWESEYAQHRRLTSDEVENHGLVASITSMDSLTASGGLCAPAGASYDMLTLPTAARPLRDSLPRFGAERGGIRFLRASTIDDMDGAVDVITEAEDAASATKPCLTITCADVQEVLTSAVTRCLTVGNFNARTHPEMLEHVVELAISRQARLAETTLFTTMCNASTAVTAGENLSTTRDVIAVVARASAQYRSRHRLPDEMMIRAVFPSWLRDMMRADLSRSAPGDDTISVADARIATWFSNLHVAPVWSLDADQTFGVQAAGGLNPWPDAVTFLLYAEGVWLYLDGGVLDLGVVRDSVLNVTNDFQTFAEVFENVAQVGAESLCITADVCPSGITSGPLANIEDILCVSGS